MATSPELWSLQRQPAFRRSAGVATAAYVVALLAPALIALGSQGAPVLSALGGILGLAGLVWGAQAVHRVATNIDVAAEAVYAERYAERVAEAAGAELPDDVGC